MKVLESIARFIPNLDGSEAEILDAVDDIRDVLEIRGLDFYDLSDLLRTVYDQAHRDGWDACRRASQTTDATGTVIEWREIARFCRDRDERLAGHESDFVTVMCRWTADCRALSDKQASWLLSLWTRLKREPEQQPVNSGGRKEYLRRQRR